MTDGTVPAVRCLGVTKWFAGSCALDDVTFDVAPGTCHALCGENGAGKSTLSHILAGIQVPDAGTLLLHGVPVRFAGPRDALAAGIGLVHQELVCCDTMTVAENLCLGRLPHRYGLVDRAALRARAEALLAEVAGGDAPAIDVTRTIGDLTVGQRQLVQIAGAVGSGARLLILDEPTSSLSEHEARHLYALVARLRARGVTLLYVSHRMPEIFRLCDAITVLRDGRHVATRPTVAMTEDELVRLMVGRPTSRTADGACGGGGRTGRREVLRVERLQSPGRFEDISFTVRSGEIVGLAGLVGAGRSQILEALFGLDSDVEGGVYLDGAAVRLRHPHDAMRHGIGLVPEDRKRQGLVLGLGGRENLVLPILDRLATRTLARAGAERALTARYFAQLAVRAPGVDAPVAGLSGGNQQKVVLARWLAAQCRVLLLDEPTRGVDVGAKAEIHALVRALAREGAAIVLVSSELPELLQLADRVLVMRAGRCVSELAPPVEPETVLRWMTGIGGTMVSAASSGVEEG